MDISLFPPLYAKKKEEELNEYVLAQTKEASAIGEEFTQEFSKKRAAIEKKYRFVDEDFGSYFKTMLVVYAILFAIVGAIGGPFLMFAANGTPDNIFLCILLAILGSVGGAIGGALGSFAAIMFTSLFTLALSPILYFLIYRPIAIKRLANMRAKIAVLQQELDVQKAALAIPTVADFNVRRRVMEEEVAKYTEAFEAQALFMKNQFGENPLVKEIAAWLVKKYLTHLRSLKRTEDIESLETTFSFTVYKTKISAMKEDFKFSDHRVKNLDEDIDKMALAIAVMTEVDMALVHSDEYYALGDDIISLSPSHTYLANPNSPAVRIDFTYQAKNRAFVPVQDWVAPPKPIHDQK